jgi:hypothetical protein
MMMVLLYNSNNFKAILRINTQALTMVDLTILLMPLLLSSRVIKLNE